VRRRDLLKASTRSAFIPDPSQAVKPEPVARAARARIPDHFRARWIGYPQPALSPEHLRLVPPRTGADGRTESGFAMDLRGQPVPARGDWTSCPMGSRPCESPTARGQSGGFDGPAATGHKRDRRGRAVLWPWGRHMAAPQTGFLFRTDIEHADGRVEPLISVAAWKTRKASIASLMAAESTTQEER
jgi:hypothetical protein